MKSSSPALILELVGPILTQAVRLARPRRFHPHHFQAVVAILNVLPRTCIPLVSDAAIMVMPWIDTEFACKIGNLWLLDTLHFRLTRPPTNRPLHYLAYQALRNAAEQGHIHVLHWWKSHIGTLDDDSDRAILRASCTFGHLDILKWWIENGTMEFYGGWGWAVEAATRHGHVDILNHLHGNGFPFTLLACGSSADLVLNGKIEVVKWFVMQDVLLSKVPKQVVTEAFLLSVVNRERPILTSLLAMDHVLKRFKDAELMELSSWACATGDLEFIEYCHQTFPDGVKHSLGYLIASSFGHLHVLDWLDKHVIPQEKFWLSDASLRHLGHHNLDFGVSTVRRVQLRFSPYFTAILSGHVRVLDWLQEHLFIPHLESDRYCLKYASVGVLGWMEKHNPELFSAIDVAQSLQHASQTGATNVLDWWAQHLVKESMVSLSEQMSLREAPLAVWKWWKDFGLRFSFGAPDAQRQFDSPPSLDTCSWLLENGHFPMWKLPEWINKVGYSADSDSFLAWAQEHDLVEPLFLSQGQDWPLHRTDSFLITWPNLLWWIENGSPEFKTRLQRTTWSFSNALKMDYCLAFCGRYSNISVDGDLLSYRNAVVVLEWALQAGVSIQHKGAMSVATHECNIPVLDWWLRHADRLNPVIPKAASVARLCQGDQDVWEWWIKSGLLNGLSEFEDLAFGFEEELMPIPYSSLSGGAW